MDWNVDIIFQKINYIKAVPNVIFFVSFALEISE